MKELSVVIVLKEDLYFKSVGVFLGKMISTLLMKDEELKKIHENNDSNVKKYTFSHFYQKEDDGIYKKGVSYSFKIRSTDFEFLEELRNKFENEKSEFAYFLVTEYHEIRSEGFLYRSVTPVISIRTNSGEKYFANDINLKEYKEKLESTILKFYKNEQGIEERLEHSFIKKIELLTKKPIGIRYKDATFLGHKVKIEFETDEFSEKLKNLTLAIGLGEKTTVVGSGFLEAIKR